MLLFGQLLNIKSFGNIELHNPNNGDPLVHTPAYYKNTERLKITKTKLEKNAVEFLK